MIRNIVLIHMKIVCGREAIGRKLTTVLQEILPFICTYGQRDVLNSKACVVFLDRSLAYEKMCTLKKNTH